jgi:predicted cobalt transporter CbtA
MTEAVQQSPPLGFGRLFGRLVLAGLVAGAAAGVFSLLVTERAMTPALELERTRQAADGDQSSGAEVFNRGTQLLGGFLGTLLAGVALAVVFAAVYGLIRHRLPGRGDFTRVVLLAAIGFGVFALLPAVKVPANPPAVGDPGTVGTRTAVYGAVLLCGVASAMLVSALVSLLRSRGAGVATTSIAAVIAAAVLLGLVLGLLPGNPDTIPADVPASIVWDFRIASLGQLAVLWATLGLLGGWLLDRLERHSTATHADHTDCEARGDVSAPARYPGRRGSPRRRRP